MNGLPVSAAETNSKNVYNNLTVENSFLGVYLLGVNSAGLQDDSTIVSNCKIGGNTQYDIGGGLTNNSVAGIWASNQINCSVYGNIVKNVAGQNLVYGIFFDVISGTSSIYKNNVTSISNPATASAVVVSGIRANMATGTHTVRIYNNFISGITTNYATATATTYVRGINLQVGGGSSATSIFEVSHNSVYIDASSSIGASSSCLDVSASSTTGPQIKIRSNIFANFTGSQTGLTSKHFCCKMNSNTLIGSTGSTSNNNDFYILNSSNGFVGRGTTTDWATLTNWQTAHTGMDASSLSVDPIYASSTDLHIVNPALNSTAAEVTTDDSVDTNTSGFIVNQDTATNVNVNGATYIYLAIA